MFKSPVTVIPLLSVLFAACTGASGPAVEPAPSSTDAPTKDATADGTTDAPAGTDANLDAPDPSAATNACGATVRSTLPGVSLHFPDQPCSLTAAQAKNHSFPWELTVTESPGTLNHTMMHTCDGIQESGFHPREKLHGNEQRYELSDRGRCRPPELVSTPVAGTFSQALAWDGVNWSGPSDFGNPKGKPFPAGDYTFLVEMRGTTNDGAEWEVVGELPFSLTDAVAAPPKRGEGPGDAPAKSAPAEPVQPAKPIIRHPVDREHVPPTPG